MPGIEGAQAPDVANAPQPEMEALAKELPGRLRLAEAAGELSEDGLRSLSAWLASR